MRTIGLIGGCGAESTALYYEGINRQVRQRRPGHGAKLLLWSFDFDEIDACCRTGDWDRGLEKFKAAAGWLEQGGAETILLCTNTMHRIADPLAMALARPLLNIIDVTAEAMMLEDLHRPVLLGTRFTMKETFYRERLERFGFDVRLPDAREQEEVHAVIYEELIQGRITAEGQAILVDVVERLSGQGADSVILACTELGLLIKPEDVSVTVLDTAALHIDAAVKFALGDRVLEKV